jgi:hypothetical protein
MDLVGWTWRGQGTLGIGRWMVYMDVWFEIGFEGLEFGFWNLDFSFTVLG